MTRYMETRTRKRERDSCRGREGERWGGRGRRSTRCQAGLAGPRQALCRARPTPTYHKVIKPVAALVVGKVSGEGDDGGEAEEEHLRRWEGACKGTVRKLGWEYMYIYTQYKYATVSRKRTAWTARRLSRITKCQESSPREPSHPLVCFPPFPFHPSPPPVSSSFPPAHRAARF